MRLWSVKLICFYHLSWSVQAHRQQPRIAVHPLDSHCLFTQVWRTIFSSARAAALMCAMFFHLLFIISFHILKVFTLKKCYLADVSVCFWLLWAGFKSLFFIFCFHWKRILGVYKPSDPHSRNCPDAPKWKTAFVWLLSDTWTKILISWCYLEGKGFV